MKIILSVILISLISHSASANEKLYKWAFEQYKAKDTEAIEKSIVGKIDDQTYLVLIATNCIVLSVPILSVESNYLFGMSVVFAIGSGMGFALALVLMASLREKLAYANVPKALQGTGVAFIVAGMLSLAFLGFSGMI